jgi:hypothetical protein
MERYFKKASKVVINRSSQQNEQANQVSLAPVLKGSHECKFIQRSFLKSFWYVCSKKAFGFCGSLLYLFSIHVGEFELKNRVTSQFELLRAKFKLRI